MPSALPSIGGAEQLSLPTARITFDAAVEENRPNRDLRSVLCVRRAPFLKKSPGVIAALSRVFGAPTCPLWKRLL